MTTATIRLACSACDRADKDNITPDQLEQCKAEGWTDITEVQTFEEACRTYDDPADEPAGYDIMAWCSSSLFSTVESSWPSAAITKCQLSA
jgi:hypothetical protein